MSDLSDDLRLLADLGIDLEPEPQRTYTAREARLIAGFEDIQRFEADHGRAPRHGEEGDIFERLYAVRLDALRDLDDARELLAPFDTTGLLDTTPRSEELLDDDALLSALGVDLDAENSGDITQLRHVTPFAHRRAAEEIASREVCRDFDTYAPVFKRAKAQLASGTIEARESIRISDFQPGALFVVNGQLALIAEKGEEFDSSNEGSKDAKLLVVYDNGTESRDLLMRSLQRALHKDKAGRVLSRPDAGPLFSGEASVRTGLVYVLRSLSDDPAVAPHRDAIVKIGATGGEVSRRLTNAEYEPTFLLAPVQLVDEYALFNIKPSKMENMLHTIFAESRLDISITDRFGNPVKSTEWFAVPPSDVAVAVERIQAGTIGEVTWSSTTARFVEADR